MFGLKFRRFEIIHLKSQSEYIFYRLSQKKNFKVKKTWWETLIYVWNCNWNRLMFRIEWRYYSFVNLVVLDWTWCFHHSVVILDNKTTSKKFLRYYYVVLLALCQNLIPEGHDFEQTIWNKEFQNSKISINFLSHLIANFFWSF